MSFANLVDDYYIFIFYNILSINKKRKKSRIYINMNLCLVENCFYNLLYDFYEGVVLSY